MNNNKIVVGDCCKVLSKYDDDSIDMIITSPPYDSLRNYQGYSFNFEKIATELYRVLKKGRVIVWVVNDATVNRTETGTSFRQALFFKEIGLNLHDTMIFKKKNAIPQIYRKRYTNEFEYMFVFSKGEVEVHNPIRVPSIHAGLELGSTTYKNYSKNKQKRGKLAKPVKDTKIRGNIWEYVVGKNKIDNFAKHHPAPFPVQLAIDHILSWSNKGETVLDPMCGIGSSCIASIETNRNYIGIDVSKEYCKLARERIKLHTSQRKLNI